MLIIYIYFIKVNSVLGFFCRKTDKIVTFYDKLLLPEEIRRQNRRARRKESDTAFYAPRPRRIRARGKENC